MQHHRRKLITFILPGLAVVGLAVAVAHATSRKAEKIVARHVTAIGGKRFRSVTALRAVGTAEVRGMSVPITLWRQRPDRSRLELTILGRDIIQAYDGENAWWVNPVVGANEPQEMPDDFARELILWSDFDGPLIDYKRKRHEIDYLGQEMIESGAAHKLRVVLRDTEVYVYIDCETYFEVKRTHTQIFKGRATAVNTYFSRFADVAGIKTPHVIRGVGFAGEPFTMRFDSVAFDVEPDDSRFDMPGRKRKHGSGYGF